MRYNEGSGDEGLIYHHAPFHEAQSLSQNREVARAWFLLIFRPTPSCRLSLICEHRIIPRPRGVGGAGGNDDGVASVMMIAGEYAFLLRSLAHARSLFRIHCVGR